MAWPARWIRVAPIEDEDGRWAICSALASVQGKTSPPLLMWVQGAARHDFALIVPRRFAPGRPSRWAAWALSPTIALCRQFGMPVYLDEGRLWLHGRSFADSRTEEVGEGMLTEASMTIPFPVERHVEDSLRLRIEAQHEWRFETSWPTPLEANAMAEARSEFAW